MNLGMNAPSPFCMSSVTSIQSGSSFIFSGLIERELLAVEVEIQPG